MGFDRIAEVLNVEGLKPRTGAQWWGKTMNNIVLANRILAALSEKVQQGPVRSR
jgi:hypothetical protein